MSEFEKFSTKSLQLIQLLIQVSILLHYRCVRYIFEEDAILGYN